MDQPVKDSRRPSVTPDGTAGAPAAEATDGDREAPLGEGGGVVVPSPSFRVLGTPGRPLSGNRVGVPPLVVRRSSSSVAVAEVASVRVKRHIESPEASNSFRASLQSELQKFESAAVQFHPDRRVVRDRSQRNLIAKLDAAHEELENRQAKVDASKQSVSSKGGIRFREDPASQSVSPEGKRVSPKPRRVHLLERALKRTLQDEADFPDDEERWGEITRPSSPVSLSGKEKEAKDAKRPAEPPGFQAGGRRQSLDERVSRGVGGWLDSEGYRSVSPERVGIAPSSHRENLNTKLRDDDMEAAGQKVKCLDKREHQGVTSQVVAEKIAAISSLEMNIKSFYDGCHPAAIGVPSDWKAHAVEVAAVGAAGQTLRKSHTSAALQNFRLGGASGMGRRSSIKIVEDEETPEEREKKLKARLQLFKYFRSERVAQDTENFAKKDRKVGLQVTCKWSGWQAEKAAKREAALASKLELPPVTTLKALLDESRSQREKRTRLRKEAWERSCEVHENRIMRIESDVKRKNAALDMHLRSLPVGQPSATPAQQEALRSLRRWRQRRWYWILMMWPTIAQWAVRFAFHRLQYRLTTMRKENLARKYVALWRKRVACFKRLRLFRAFGKFGQMLARSQMLGRASGKLAKFLDELLRFLTIKDLRHAGRILISTSRFQRTYQKSKSHWRETHAKMHDQFVVLERSLCSHRYQTPECVKAVLSGSPTLSSPGRKSRARINSALNEFASADERMLGAGLTEPDENLFADGATTFREEEEVTERSDLSAPSMKVPAAASIALSRMSSKSSVGAKSAKSISRQKSSKGKGGKGKKKKKEEDSFWDLDDPADSLLLDDDTRRDLLKQLIKQRRRSYQHALMKWKAQMEAFRRECRLKESKVWSLKPLDPVSYLEPGAGMHAAVAAAEREAAFINKQSEIHGIRAVIMPAPPDHPRTYHKEEAKTILMDFYRMERRCKEQEEATGQMLVESCQTLTNLMSKRLEKQKKKKGGSKSVSS